MNPDYTVWLLTLDSYLYMLRFPLPLKVSVSFVERQAGVEQEYCATLAEFSTYGNGRDEAEAVDVFRRRFLETFIELKENQNTLGPGPLAELARYRQVLTWYPLNFV